MSRRALVATYSHIALALLVSTFFQPDEYFQSLEIAHRMVFGYGHTTWEWTAAPPIRSPLFPALFTPVYGLLRLMGADESEFLVIAPKLLNGLFAAITDRSLCHLTTEVVGERYVDTALFLSITSLFNALSLTRSLSNALETSLTTLAMSYYPWHDHPVVDRDRVWKCILYAAMACMVRPTNAIIWVLAFAWRIYCLVSLKRPLTPFLADLILIGTGAVATVLGVDSLYYGRLTFTPLNFLRANLSVASFYGVNQWHYYLTQGIPILCTTALPFAIHGAFLMASSREPSVRPRYNLLLGVIAWTVAVYSLGQHKEWRFIHPLLPLMHVCAAKSLVDLFFRTDSKGKTKVKPERTAARQLLPIRRSHLALLLLNVPLIPYVLLVHGRAQIAVMRFLRTLPPSELDSVGFLMPCHSTPWQSHLHRPKLAVPGRMWALGCEPPLGRDPLGYESQTDVFYENPAAYLATYFPVGVSPSFPPSPYPATIPGSVPPSANASSEGPAYPWRHEWPRFLIFFSALLADPGIEAALVDHGYTRTWRTWNGFEEDERRKGGVEVWKWQAPHAQVKQLGF